MRGFHWRIFFALTAVLLPFGVLVISWGEAQNPGAVLLLGLVAIPSLWLLAWWISAPLRVLRNQAEEVARGERGKIQATARQDEIGQTGQAINALVDLLQNQIAALQSEQGTLRAMLHTMNDGVVIVNPAGRVILSNPASEALFQIPAGQAVGRSLAEVLRQHQLMTLWERCRATGEEQRLTLEIPLRRLFIESIATPLGEAMPGHVLMLFQDLTRIRRLETVRRDFISNISHELRTPLASLKALAETLRSGALEDPPAARRFLERIEIEVDALAQMVNELLELSRIESGQMPLKQQSVEPLTLLQTALERMRAQAERKGLTLAIEAADNLPAVLADASRLEQVLVNLLHNAIKFTPQGGSITLGARQEGDNVIFRVADNGAGIPADDLPRIFERFYKSDRARSGSGTGLGLAIAKHIVEAHGGKIWVESVEGEGSVFMFGIPRGD